MSLSEAPSVKITYSTPQDVSDEILGGVIHFCRNTGYNQNMIMLTFFWSSFLLNSKKILDDNGILNDTLNCYACSLEKVFPKISEDTTFRETINNMRNFYWNKISDNFDSLLTETEIISFIKIANKLNKGDNTSDVQFKKDPLKSYSQYAYNINSSIYRILHGIDNEICIQYKYVLDEIRFARVQQKPKTVTAKSPDKVSANIAPATNTVNVQSQSVHKTNETPIVSKPTVSEKPTFMFCRKCGAKLYEDSIFCHKCGTKTVPDGDK